MPDADTMKIDPTRAAQLTSNLQTILQRIHAQQPPSRPVRLIAVSKLHPATDILALTQHRTSPHHDFGENYVQELTAKADILPRSVRWHMIGSLQTNKCKGLAEKVPNLFCVSGVDAVKKAEALDRGRGLAVVNGRRGVGESDGDSRLKVLVQVNTSGEEAKAGTQPGEETLQLCRFVREKCSNLRLGGLMTIGAIARSGGGNEVGGQGENEDFVCLREERDRVAAELGLENREELELSMGMSNDFEEAIRSGSQEVRVGTGIFGQRPAKGDAVV